MKLTDYQIADAFGDTLSLIYREKMEELDAELQPVLNSLEGLNVPRYTDFDRLFYRLTLPDWAKADLAAIEHMKKIRALHKKMKKNPDQNRLNVEKARAVPITEIYDFGQRRSGQNVSCPFHPDKHPSASIKYNRLHCFQCGVNYDGIALFMKLNEVSFQDAVTALSK